MPRARIATAILTAAVIVAGSIGSASIATAAPTGGSGGALTNRLDQSFTSGGITSTYHVFASGLDWTKQVGLLMYADGSGGYGLDNPNSTYLLDADGTAGLVAIAKKHNLLLVTPKAPAPSCEGYDNCWFNDTGTPTPVQKAAWSNALMSSIKAQYNIENDRIVVGGYSSGAQWQRWFLPAHAEAQSVDLAVMIAYGGAPAVATNYSTAYKSQLKLSWDTGTADPAYTSASYGAIGGYNWYKNAGFQVDATWPAGVGHARDGEFDAILDREITQHLKAAGTTTTPSYVAWSHTIAPTRTGAQLTVDIPAGVTTTFRVSASPITTQTGFYDTTTVTGDNVKDLALTTSLSPGTTYYYTIETAGRLVQKSGTFKTLP